MHPNEPAQWLIMSKKQLIFVLILILILILLPITISKVVSSSAKADYRAPVQAPIVPKTPRELVSDAFPDVPIMVHVSDAESTICTHNFNPISSAKGCFAILDSTWRSEHCLGNVLEPADNIACARKLYDKYGLSPWQESKYLWEKYLIDKK